MFEELDVLSEGLEVSGAKESLMEVSKRFFDKTNKNFFNWTFFSFDLYKNLDQGSGSGFNKTSGPGPHSVN
jgi:hypothetical protein